MTPDQIKPGSSYVGSGASKARTVLQVRNGVVEYVVDGLLTFAALTMPIDQFAAWAERKKPDNHLH